MSSSDVQVWVPAGHHFAWGARITTGSATAPVPVQEAQGCRETQPFVGMGKVSFMGTLTELLDSPGMTVVGAYVCQRA